MEISFGESDVRIKELDACIAGMDVRIKELDVKIESVRAQLKRDMAEMEMRLKMEIELVRRDIKESQQRMVVRLGGMMFLAVGAMATLVKLL